MFVILGIAMSSSLAFSQTTVTVQTDCCGTLTRQRVTPYDPYDGSKDVFNYVDASGKTLFTSLPGYFMTNKNSLQTDYLIFIKSKTTNKFGIARTDSGNSIVVEPKYDAIGKLNEFDAPANNDFLFWFKQDGKIGILHYSTDYYGTSRTEGIAKYDEAKLLSDGKIAIRIGAKWGYADKYGKEIIAPKYDEVRAFGEDPFAIAPVKLGTKWYALNLKGTQVAGPFDSEPYHIGTALAAKSGTELDYVFPSVGLTTYLSVDKVSVGYPDGEDNATYYRVLSVGGKYGYVDATGVEQFGGCVYDTASITPVCGVALQVTKFSMFAFGEVTYYINPGTWVNTGNYLTTDTSKICDQVAYEKSSHD